MIKINKRVSFIDMMKGFLILTVVIGHANITLFGFDVFWFHMPSFFIITGLLTKKFICLGDNKSVIEKALHFIIPYLSYSIVLYLIFREDNVFKYIMRVILAGRMNITTFSYPFWYIFSLFWALLFYGTIKKINSSDKLTGGVIFSVWIIIHLLSMNNIKYILPWGLDCAAGSLCFIYIGDLFKRYNYNVSHSFFILLPITIHILLKFYGYTYVITMASNYYNHPILDIVIPFSCFFALYHLCRLLNHFIIFREVLSFIGRCSITIYFIHAAVLYSLKDCVSNAWAAVAAIIFGCLLHYIFSLNKTTSLLFLGNK